VSTVCAYPPCDTVIENPKHGQRFCSDAHRVADWREKHQPRCPSCHIPIEVSVSAAEMRRSVRQEGD